MPAEFSDDVDIVQGFERRAYFARLSDFAIIVALTTIGGSSVYFSLGLGSGVA